MHVAHGHRYDHPFPLSHALPRHPKMVVLRLGYEVDLVALIGREDNGIEGNFHLEDTDLRIHPPLVGIGIHLNDTSVKGLLQVFNRALRFRSAKRRYAIDMEGDVGRHWHAGRDRIGIRRTAVPAIVFLRHTKRTEPQSRRERAQIVGTAGNRAKCGCHHCLIFKWPDAIVPDRFHKGKQSPLASARAAR